jgi:hypothetical protein
VGAGFLAGIVVVGAWFLVEYAMGWIRVVGTEPAAVLGRSLDFGPQR